MDPKLTPVDMIDVAAMRTAGWTLTEIGAHFGVHRTTVHRYLSDWGMEVQGDGPRLKCFRGHHLTPENTRVYKDGRRECRECKRARDREYQKRKYWASKKSA